MNKKYTAVPTPTTIIILVMIAIRLILISSMKVCGIYKIINKRNGKFYIGSSTNIKIRWYTHTTQLLRNVHKNIHLQRAWNKYGRNNFQFQIMEQFGNNFSIKELLQEEQRLLDIYCGNPKCYNMNKRAFDLNGSNNPFYGKQHTIKTKKILSDIALKRDPNKHPWIGRRHSIESINKISLSKIGKTCGNKHSQYDHNIYTFTKNNEIFEGSRFVFCEKYNLNKGNVCWLIKGKNKSVKGWSIRNGSHHF